MCSQRSYLADFSSVFFSVILILATVLVFSLFHGWRSVPCKTIRNIKLGSIQNFHSIKVLSRSSAELTIRYALRHNPYFIIPIENHVRHTKVHLSFAKLENISQIRIYLGFAGQLEKPSRYIALPVGKPGALRHEYNALLPDGDYDTLIINFRSGKHFGTAVLRAVSLHPSDWRDASTWGYVMAVIIAFLIILPGMLLCALIHGHDMRDDTFLVSSMTYSVIFYLTSYMVWLFWCWFHLPRPDLMVCCFIFSGLPLLTVLNVTFRRNTAFIYQLMKSRLELTGYILLLLGICFLIMRNVNLPLENTWYTTIAGPKTFNAFHAHDAVFQYINGVAISNNEPFAKYYGGRQLIYGVEDRGILPGVIYAIFRITLRNFSQLLADSYLIYTIIGVVFNMLILFPVLAFVRRYSGMQNRLLFILAFSLNAFILVNYYLTWYKMAAAAFFLGGLYLILQVRPRIKDWVLAGILLGIGTNMHAGSALGIPFFFLLAVWKLIRNHYASWKRCLGVVTILLLIFTSANLPWSMVKHFYLHENYTLIKQHFLAGYSDPAGLEKSAELFFENIPLARQIPQRIKRLSHSLRLGEISELVHALTKNNVRRGLLLWDQDEFNYAAFVLYPLVLLAILAWVLPDKKQLPRDNLDNVVAGADFSAATLFVVSIITLATVILLSYGLPPDITYHLPMGVLILIYALLIGQMMCGNRYVRIVGAGYYGLVAFRLFLFY